MRYAFAIIGLLVVVGVLAGVKGAQIGTLMSAGKKMEAAGPPPESVSTARAEERAWAGSLSAVGSIAAVKGVRVSNEMAGTVTRISFDSGAHVREGDVLVELESKVERAQLQAAHARQELAAVQRQRSVALVKSGALPQSQLDADQSALDALNAEVRAYGAQIARKTVRAPFTGVLGIRAINLGQYLEPGTAITSLETITSVFVDFTLPQQELASVRDGMPVRITLGGGNEPPFEGKIVALDPQVDPVTRAIKIRATIPNEAERLRPGMFVNVSVVLPDEAKIVTIPATGVIHAAYGDSVFVVEDKKGPDGSVVKDPNGEPVKVVRQQFVRLGERRGDFVGLREGLRSGEEVVVAGAFKLRNGVPVTVRPDVKPAPELDPHPENR